MLFGHIKSLDTYQFLLQSNPVWKKAFQWIAAMPASVTKGIYPLIENEMYVNVMEYTTLPRKECRFESHRKYVDLQYTIKGSEIIEYRRSEELNRDGGYDEKTDLQFYMNSEASASMLMSEGSFSIFFPSDAHLPKIRSESDNSVFKLVVKINLALLNQ